MFYATHSERHYEYILIITTMVTMMIEKLSTQNCIQNHVSYLSLTYIDCRQESAEREGVTNWHGVCVAAATISFKWCDIVSTGCGQHC